ncbi:MAG: TylF/MycF/NovP-related O-methyltransferase [Acetobacteraceae bacterium]
MAALRSFPHVDRLSRFLAKSPPEKIAAIRANLSLTFKIGRQPGADAVLARHRWAAPGAICSQSPFYIALRPDSDRNHDRYPELAALSIAWVHRNEAPNATDLPRLYSLVLNIRQALEEEIAGDFAELGVYRGNSAAVLAHYARTARRQLYLFDTFEGFDARDLVGVDQSRQPEFGDTALAAVQAFVGEQNVRFIQGHFPASIPADLDRARFSVVHLDCDLYQPISAGMAFFFPRLSPGGLMIVHDYSGIHWGGVRRAVDEFLAPLPERPVLLPDRSGTVIIRKGAA